jgi:hypothetical protein
MTSPLPEYRLISLTQGQFAIVDAADYDWLNQWNWFAAWAENTQSFYARRNDRGEDGKFHVVSMHRKVLGLDRGDKRHGDHINRNTLDNRRSNLRPASLGQNKQNSKCVAGSASGLKGVSIRSNGNWQAEIAVDGKRIYLGTRKTAEAAHELYREAAQRLHGEFARTN